MDRISRRDFLYLGLTASAGLLQGAEPEKPDVHRHLLELAAKQEEQRRKRFAAVKNKGDVTNLQNDLRGNFLQSLDGLPPAHEIPPVTRLDRIDADDYSIEKLAFESFPNYHVPALLYRPKKTSGPAPGILSPCGHSSVGKAADTYQTLHINLAKRGAFVLTYDPVGQGERSQFWDAEKQRSRYNLGCGEHAVLGNPLYLLGTSLARYRIWDGIRGLDYLASLPEVDARRLGCTGNSGGGTLTAYIAALDPRVKVAVIGCYITTLPRRMANRIERDPDADPEQDIFTFLQRNIDHAGLLALRAPRPTLVVAAKQDFFPIEGTRESVEEAKKIFATAEAPDAMDIVEADDKHGLTLPLREATYAWFDRWLFEHNPPRAKEIEVKPRTPAELLVCKEGQVNISYKSRPMLPMVLAEYQKRKKPEKRDLKPLLRLDPDAADFRVTQFDEPKGGQTHVLCINGNESGDWRDEKEFLKDLSNRDLAVAVMDPRGAGKFRPALEVKGHDYADPLVGVEENIAYNAFLVGKVLLGMRVADVLKAMNRQARTTEPSVILCGRRDAALVALFAAAISPDVKAVAVEDVPLSFLPLFEAGGQAINAASIVPGLLRDFGDLPEVLETIAPRRVLVAAPRHKPEKLPASVKTVERPFSKESSLFTDWLKG